MGSAFSSAVDAAVGLKEQGRAFGLQDGFNRLRFLHQLKLPFWDRQRPSDRWLAEYERKYPHLVTRGPFTPEQRNAYIARPHAHSALRHYNSNNPGAEFESVKPLMCARVGFRDGIWFHVNFLARRKGAPPDTPLEHFFAEIHYGCFDTPFVETCTILEKPLDRLKKKCAFCNGSFEILHPSEEEFICGKKRQKKEFYRTRNIVQREFYFSWP
ncbi:uncharacterized protein LOC104583720 isoform X1 [Brachypodium distachyon]|uniref:uncharacterized protein LOC104583720 isoform X1 n=1 Tax=Brachypodium distachyon TaxID=15368 RepID=UPI00052FF3F9|nr:uncharacterized protein LOC104583720 isoform X1 [Brachypodium distachyon]|eukprot:XP_024316383.1 uncharacterized protein LOC104583720 isoform X1 [Brachypodium distachyon]